MAGSLLRVPRTAPITPTLYQTLIGRPGGSWAEINVNAVYYNGTTYFGYMAPGGTIRVASYNHATHAVAVSPAIVSGLVTDDHDAPGVLVRQSDHKIVMACAPHSSNHMYIAVSTNAEDVTSWGAATDIASTLAGGAIYTYPSLVQLSGESGKIYLFYRDGDPTTTAKTAYSTSTDGGSTWAAETVLFSAGTGKGVYFAVDNDGTSRIDFVASDGNAANDGTNCSLYHFYYTGGNYYKSDGTLIGGSGSLPLAPANTTKIHDGSTSGALSTTMDVSRNGSNVYVAYSAANTGGLAGNPMNLWYGVWSGSSWTTNDVTDTGVNGTDRGICLSRDTPSTTIFLGKVVSGSSKMQRYVTSNGGSSWAEEDLTGVEPDQSQLNSDPISPWNAVPSLEALWVYGDFAGAFLSAEIRGFPNPQNI